MDVSFQVENLEMFIYISNDVFLCYLWQFVAVMTVK